ncbi:MAG: type II toxin-antitoxin system RelE/ParE family toxin [bacterium]|nr:type II toxin-antitoxin system RelE/ParE family toxin [bacterium]
MGCKIYFFQNDRGEEVVTKFIQQQEKAAISKISRKIDLLAQYGFLLGMPHAKKITTDLYELRIRGVEELRIIYGFNKGNAYLLHGFKKQTQEISGKDLDVASIRYKKLLT